METCCLESKRQKRVKVKMCLCVEKHQKRDLIDQIEPE